MVKYVSRFSFELVHAADEKRVLKVFLELVILRILCAGRQFYVADKRFSSLRPRTITSDGVPYAGLCCSSQDFSQEYKIDSPAF